MNIAYLAIPSIDVTDYSSSIEQLASLLSTISSTGCIVIGLLLVGQDQTDPKGDPLQVCALQSTGKIIMLYPYNSL